MVPSFMRRAAVSLAVVTTASLVVVGLTGTGTASAHGARLDTRLTASAPATVGLDGDARVRGRLSSHGVPLQGRLVRLVEKTEGGSWSGAGSQRTTGRGKVAFPVSPEVPTAYRLVFVGTGRLDADLSPVVRVAPRATAITIAAAPTVLEPGESAQVSGVVTASGAPLAGAAVELLARPRAGRPYVEVAEGTTAEDGSVAFTVTPARSTQYVIRLPKTDTAPAARSDRVDVRVKAPTRLAVRAAKIHGDQVVSGVLLSRGDALRGRKVTLEEQAVGATEFTAVKTKRTARDGWVVFRVTRVEGTSYRLVFAGNRDLAGSVSRTVTS